MERNDDIIIKVETESGEVDCVIICTYECNKRDYIALMPQDGSNEILLYRYKELPNEEGIEIMNISSDMEFEVALEAFDAIIQDGDMKE